ncbi:oxygen-independent coproporphyrinogen-3 oxidase [Sphingomonas kyeonggiensis]|uniref:Coproporphyrinogen-III oxidase n=1 Tax=Sphingomonas kyeonggiensis TaxID=1268553 RepID=A0A7W7K0S3_9SPHN|nr:oxygen-independent coproporphyrinogen III oxidase [Sphingomonas kyeonggiensis]MBB4838566.1 oxygen-independent coproporphyrinogen-3 oxidase [Sphingomonas kyeonggiensis]
MWTYHPELLATPVPRYTSFPTAAEFGDDVGPADMEHALARVREDEPISLYLHVPYCHEICWYCGCNTGAANRTSRVAAYVQRLGEEIDLIARRLDGRGKVARIAWGGGSPNALAPSQFDALMHRVRAAFACSEATVSVELDPRGFDWGWADCFGRNKVTRASLGVQTFAPHIQRAIGRIQPTEEIACTVGRLRAARVESINFDLMYGLPGQFAEDLDETLRIALSMRPERFAVFGYAHVPHLLPRQRRIDATRLPGAAIRFAMAQQAHRLLRGAGYDAIGFDHFAMPHDAIARAARSKALRRNFQGFTEDPSDVLIGLGASSISAFPGALLQNEKNAGRYHLRIGNGQLATARGIRRGASDRRRGAIIEALLCRNEAECTGLPDLADIRERLAPFEEYGLIAWAGTRLLLDRGALPYARSIAATFDPWRAASTTRFSSAV